MTIDNNDFIQKSSELIQLTAQKMELAQVGKFLLNLTPESVTKTSAPPFRDPRAVIPFDINQGIKSLHKHSVTSHGETKTVHVYEAGIKFPAHHQQGQKIVEVAIYQIGWGKLELVKKPFESNATYEKREKRCREAFGYNRYWFAVPTSYNIHIEDRQITFTNREYARRFAEFNHLEGGVWKSEKQRTNAIIGIVVGVVGSIAPFFFMERLFERFDWLSIIIIMAISLIAITAASLIASRGKESLSDEFVKDEDESPKVSVADQFSDLISERRKAFEQQREQDQSQELDRK